MANTIRIRRRADGSGTGAPGSLANAELAFNEQTDVLYYGEGTGGAGGTATAVIAIGGSGAFATLDTTQTISGTKSFSNPITIGTPTSGSHATTKDYVDTAISTATATEVIQDVIGAMVSSNVESGISVSYDDDNGKLDFNVNDPTITISGDVDGSATMTNLGNTTISVELDTVNANTGNFGSATAIPVITVNAKGLVTAVSTASISTTLTVGADTGTEDSVALATDTLSFLGGEGIDTTVSNNTITISGEDASTSNKGIASFNSASFDTVAGAVSIKAAGVSNAQLANSSLTIGSTSTSLGSTSTALAGLTELTVDNLNFNNAEITSIGVDTNIDIVLSPKGTGSIDISNSRISNVAEPMFATDAATKYYVDNAITGLDWKSAVHLLWDDPSAAGTGPSGTLVIDSHPALTPAESGYRVLLTQNGTYKGIYIYTDDGTTYNLTRSDDADNYLELLNASVFVSEGTLYGNTGWVQSNHYLTDFSGQTWVQFSGAGAYSSGAGLGQSGTEFFVNVGADGGIEIVTDALQLKSSIAGNGLTYATGVLAVGGTADRISVGVDAIDISSTYVGQASLTTLGTIATGTWQGTIIAGQYGGTGVNNSGKTITLGGNLTTSGANALTFSTTGATNVTVPTTGTLATLVESETISNKTITNSTIGTVNPSTAAFTTLAASGIATFTSSTISTSTSTGALVVTGGVGIGGKLYVGSDLNGTGTSSLSGFVIDGGTF